MKDLTLVIQMIYRVGWVLLAAQLWQRELTESSKEDSESDSLGGGVPGRDTVCQHTLDGAAVARHQQLLL